MSQGYAIADEPRPGALAHIAVNPIWPLFAMMFAGTWLSWPWFVVNGFIVGCPARRKTLAVVVIGLVGLIVLAMALGIPASLGLLPRWSLLYLHLLFVAWKLGISYFLYMQQASTIELYQYYGGPLRNGILVVVAGYFIWDRVAASLLETSPVLYVLMS